MYELFTCKTLIWFVATQNAEKNPVERGLFRENFMRSLTLAVWFVYIVFNQFNFSMKSMHFIRGCETWASKKRSLFFCQQKKCFFFSRWTNKKKRLEHSKKTTHVSTVFLQIDNRCVSGEWIIKTVKMTSSVVALSCNL